MSKKKEITIRSSAAEYLTFITATGESGIVAIYADENVWLATKKQKILSKVKMIRKIQRHHILGVII